MPEFLRANVAHKMVGPVGMAVGMTVETGYAQAGPVGSPVFRRVELLLRKLGHEKAQTFKLLGVQDAVENLVVVVDGDETPFGHITKVGPGGQVNCRGRVRKDMLGQVEIQVKANQPRQWFRDHLREEHAPFRMVCEREGFVWETAPSP